MFKRLYAVLTLVVESEKNKDYIHCGFVEYIENAKEIISRWNRNRC